MKYKIIVLMMAGLIWAVPAGAAGYRIGPGDLIEISVWKNPDLTKQVIVLPDGKIHFPLVKALDVQGVTVEELEKTLRAKLRKYVPEPDLFVNVVQVNSMVVYVIGKVNHPGRFPVHSRIDVLKALAVAGGLNPFAKEDQIKIFRKINGKTHIFRFDYESVSRGENCGQNIMLERNDVIVVP